MSCQNCFTGCAEIISDRCVRYTGENIPSLGIETGDNLSKIEASLSTFLISALDGTGIHPAIDSQIICALIEKYLPTCTPITMADFISTLIQATCDLQEQIIVLDQSVATIEADYDIVCLEGVEGSSGTHAILQAVIIKLCAMDETLTALTLNLSTNYSSNGTELDDYITQYLLDHSSTTNLVSAKMIPYVAYPYFNTDLSNFNANGEGTGDWVKVYICNGYGGKTPDMRGRVPVAATAGPGPAITDAAVLPGGFNYSWIVGGTKYGDNSMTLTSAQVPNHTHTATATAPVQQPHNHLMFNIDELTGNPPTVTADQFAAVAYDEEGEWKYRIVGSSTEATLGKTRNTVAVNNVPVVTVNSTAGGGGAHSNTQPGIACYYIMFVP